MLDVPREQSPGEKSRTDMKITRCRIFPIVAANGRGHTRESERVTIEIDRAGAGEIRERITSPIDFSY